MVLHCEHVVPQWNSTDSVFSLNRSVESVLSGMEEKGIFCGVTVIRNDRSD